MGARVCVCGLVCATRTCTYKYMLVQTRARVGVCVYPHVLRLCGSGDPTGTGRTGLCSGGETRRDGWW